jgi:hypothetical protein
MPAVISAMAVSPISDVHDAGEIARELFRLSLGPSR